MVVAMLTCRELIGFLDDYREGRLSVAERDRFDWHLQRCPDCVAYLQSYERTLALARLAMEGPDAGLGPDVPADLVTAILASRPPIG
jgi:anti-sigma factor RsiW